MKRKLLVSCGLAAIVLATPAQGQTVSPSPSRFAWQMLRADEVHAEGWVKIQAAEDLADGLPGRLADINNDVARNVFAAQNAGYTKNTWWPGEQEGYWHEGLVNLAFLAKDQAAIERVTQWTDGILKKQGPDGYIGVYDPNTRLMPVDTPLYGETGGELHSQANGFLGLLAFYEHTGRADVLAAIERAAQLTMKTYAKGVFGTVGVLRRRNKAGGNSHVVNFADPLIQLYRLTGNEEYLKFVASMYEDYNLHTPRDGDLTRKKLTDPAALFVAHGAHTAESFHMVQAAALVGDAEAKKLPGLATAKLLRHLTPGGALISDEYIKGRWGNGADLYEHCVQHELVKSFVFLTQYTGDTAMAERAERLFFNAIQGARLHPAAAVQYLSRDDRMDIPPNGSKMELMMSSIVRPVCCSASTGRGLPYFLASSWMKSPDGKKLVAMNFAPCAITTQVAGVTVTIHEATEYPFGDQVVLTINPAQEVAFDLAIRLPIEGELKVVSASGAKESRRDGLLVLNKKWQMGDRVELALDLPILCEATQDGKSWYYRRGSLVFGLPFQSEIKTISENPRWSDNKPSGLFEYDIRVADKSAWGYRIDPKAKFSVARLAGDSNHPWVKPTLGLKGTMLDAQGKPVAVTLVPEGAAVSRRVTFLDASHSASEAAVVPHQSEISTGF